VAEQTALVQPPGQTKPWHARLVVPAAALALLLYLVLGNLSASLGRIEVADLPAHTLNSVSTQFAVHDAVDKARQAWCVWHSYRQRGVVLTPANAGAAAAQLPESSATACLKTFADPNVAAGASGDHTAARLVHWFVGLDLVFIVLYFFLALGAILRRRGSLNSGNPIEKALRDATNLVPLVLLFGGLLAAELTEDAAQWILGTPTASERLVNLAGGLLAIAPLVKLILVGMLALLLVVVVAHPLVKVPAEGMPLALTKEGSNRRKTTLRTIGLLRIQVAVVALFGLVLSGVGQNQAADALLRWGDLDGDHAAILLGVVALLASLLALGYFSLLVWRSAHRAALTDDTAAAPPPPMLVAAAAAICVAAALIWPKWPNLGGLGLVLVVVVLLSTFSGAPFWRPGREPATAQRSEPAHDDAAERAALVPDDVRAAVEGLARWLAAVPIGLAGIAVVRAALPPLLVLGSLGRPGAVRLLFLVVLGVGLLGVAVAVSGWLRRADGRVLPAPRQPLKRHTAYWLLAALAAVGYLLAVLPGTRLWFPVLVGPVAVTLLFLAFVLVVGNELQRRAELTAAVAGLRVLGAKRNPVLALLLVWFVVGSLLDTAGPNAVRIIQPATAAPRPSLQQAFTAWARANCAFGTVAGADLPMVFVAAQGGGLRAAYWTAGVLDSVFPTSPSAPTDSCGVPARSRVFALSGASGGSVGIMFWLNAPSVHRPWYQRPAVSGTNTSWYDTALSVDHLSDTLSWMLYVDGPRSLLGFHGLDHAALLEQSWEQSQAQLAGPFLRSYPQMTNQAGSGTWRPLALLNGTAVESGCRALTAPVSLTRFDDGSTGTLGCRRIPATPSQKPPLDATGLYDLTEQFLCPNQDVAMSTAALLSARFPYVTPSGRLDRCGERGARTYVVDGGYLDNSGSMSATDLHLQTMPLIDMHNKLVDKCASKSGCPEFSTDQRPVRHVRPLFVQIDNGYSSVAAAGNTSRPHELVVPPRTRLAVGGSVEQTARQRSYEAFSNVFGKDAFLRVANAPHPGVQAPTGWVLSASAREDLCQELVRVAPDLKRLSDAIGAAPPATPAC
jgi:hypothetical protein